MGRIFDSIRVFFTYWMNIFLYNREGWYLGYGEPTAEAQNFRIMAHQKPYQERTCKICKENFWSHKKSNVCLRMKCYFAYHRRKFNG